MNYPDRVLIKDRAKERVLDRSFGVLMVSIAYLLLTEWISTVVNLIWTNPLTAISDRFSESMNTLLEPVAAQGSLSEASVDASVNMALSSAVTYARQLLSQPSQEVLLFLFLLLYLYTVVMGYGFSFYAMRTARGERLGAGSLFDPLTMAGKVILLSLLLTLLVGVGIGFFIVPGVLFYYSTLLAPYVLLDHPEMSIFKAISAGWRMSKGHRVRLFTLEFSFIGWDLLGLLVSNLGYNLGRIFTSGEALGTILSLVCYTVVYAYVLPYRELSLVQFYDTIRPQDLRVEETPVKADN
ncbi:MAG: DUF975 family protein [Clostridiales bacterium]|nr:DUF975 family protein [Clostridiales bacterium]